VRILLDQGADVNAQGGHHGNALQAASSEGHDKIVQMLQEAQLAAQSTSYSQRSKMLQTS
jgi:hypothetical protein